MELHQPTIEVAASKLSRQGLAEIMRALFACKPPLSLAPKSCETIGDDSL